MHQPKIEADLIERLHRVSHAYEMPMTKMLNHIVTVALDELEGKEDEYTICIPVRSAQPAPDGTEE